ncbi:hypothetical protein E2C01_012646 [Portunus trituberculatus]|uniref:Uncharacterized protein n=1 Tax=Portunus trituberculatus TaxID=210409 RepID=A0A5B7DEF3_PORTR|nr:hypothetical protein [Portunus trituberculatus]
MDGLTEAQEAPWDSTRKHWSTDSKSSTSAEHNAAMYRKLILASLLLTALGFLSASAQDFNKLSASNYLTAFKRGWKDQHHPLRHRGIHWNGMLSGDFTKWYSGFEHSKMKRRHGGKLIPHKGI